MEINGPSSLERFLRSEKTQFARSLQDISPEKGEAYLNSRIKRTLDVVIAAPAVVVTAPILGLAAGVKALEDRKNPFYSQKRRKNGVYSLNTWKIRTMRPNAHSAIGEFSQLISQQGDAADPRITPVGKVLRKFDFDELPQLVQITRGDMTLVGSRAAPQYAVEDMQKKRKDFSKWLSVYDSVKPGLLGLASAFSHNKKDDTKRHHYDLFYAEHASLGLDLFIMYKHGEQLLKRLTWSLKKIRKPSSP